MGHLSSNNKECQFQPSEVREIMEDTLDALVLEDKLRCKSTNHQSDGHVPQIGLFASVSAELVAKSRGSVVKLVTHQLVKS